jgi:hypothetical protein
VLANEGLDRRFFVADSVDHMLNFVVKIVKLGSLHFFQMLYLLQPFFLGGLRASMFKAILFVHLVHIHTLLAVAKIAKTAAIGMSLHGFIFLFHFPEFLEQPLGSADCWLELIFGSLH